MKKMDKIPLLSRKLLFGNSDRALAKISPDGSKLAYLAPKNGFMNIWVGTPDKINESRPVSNDTVRGIRMFDWAYTSEHILYIQDKGGDENFHIFSVDLKSGNIIDLTPFDNVQARISCISSKYPDKILVLLNNRIPEYHDLYLIDITNGESELVFENKYEFAELYTDNEFRLRFSSKMTADGGSIIFQQQIDRWEKFIEIPMQDYLTTSLAGMNHSGNILYLNSSIDRNTSALITIDLTTGERKLVAEDDRSDAGGIFSIQKQKICLRLSLIIYEKNGK